MTGAGREAFFYARWPVGAPRISGKLRVRKDLHRRPAKTLRIETYSPFSMVCIHSKYRTERAERSIGETRGSELPTFAENSRIFSALQTAPG